jgi:hypothetical protein
MSWKKVSSPKDVHRCDKPRYVNEGVDIGDIIECDCGQQWKCIGAEYGMQWDPLPRGELRWEKGILRQKTTWEMIGR